MSKTSKGISVDIYMTFKITFKPLSHSPSPFPLPLRKPALEGVDRQGQVVRKEGETERGRGEGGCSDR